MALSGHSAPSTGRSQVSWPDNKHFAGHRNYSNSIKCDRFSPRLIIVPKKRKQQGKLGEVHVNTQFLAIMMQHEFQQQPKANQHLI